MRASGFQKGHNWRFPAQWDAAARFQKGVEIADLWHRVRHAGYGPDAADQTEVEGRAKVDGVREDGGIAGVGDAVDAGRVPVRALQVVLLEVTAWRL